MLKWNKVLIPRAKYEMKTYSLLIWLWTRSLSRQIFKLLKTHCLSNALASNKVRLSHVIRLFKTAICYCVGYTLVIAQTGLDYPRYRNRHATMGWCSSTIIISTALTPNSLSLMQWIRREKRVERKRESERERLISNIYKAVMCA